MEKLTYNAKVAIIKVLSEILNADSIVNDNEVEYMNEVIKSFNLDGNFQSDVDSLLTLQALSTIRELSVTLKNEVAKMMGKMIIIDEDINYNEVKLYNTFCKSCDIEKNFNINDYPELSLSGPFINSEDIMAAL
ncbi:hypothetical protein J5A71_11025 [Prevotella melaninogenica]|mgnify:CR=1 FL=1|jgi:hypothetical protein|uniref:hypothetical protein n=1 Tax=Prevotella melaninogenica TaxID=28132 RepID=UPI001BA46063|nr:hypothetical protein [Prevotella melaninogenica]QUB57027.1 hypothetical protein J5A72_11295 [Prevotella melaninogenica]QUB59233.1 hypothetical protein J5A71_11025 [Prevotella melaninogenica]